VKSNNTIIRITKKINRDKSKLLNVNVHKFPDASMALIEALYKFRDLYKDKYSPEDFKKLFETLKQKYPQQFQK